jgi:hypothetical protein
MPDKLFSGRWRGRPTTQQGGNQRTMQLRINYCVRLRTPGTNLNMRNRIQGIAISRYLL